MADDLRSGLRRPKDHADRHFAEPLTLEDLAAVAMVSKYDTAEEFDGVDLSS